MNVENGFRWVFAVFTPLPPRFSFFSQPRVALSAAATPTTTGHHESKRPGRPRFPANVAILLLGLKSSNGFSLAWLLGRRRRWWWSCLIVAGELVGLRKTRGFRALQAWLVGLARQVFLRGRGSYFAQHWPNHSLWLLRSAVSRVGRAVCIDVLASCPLQPAPAPVGDKPPSPGLIG